MNNKTTKPKRPKSDNTWHRWLKKRYNIGKNETSLKNNENFIIKYNRLNAATNGTTSIELKRVIFISLIGLYQTWRQVPSLVLYPAIFLLPLKREWIYNKPTNDLYELQLNPIFASDYFSGLFEDKEFIELLKWKDQQQLVFWMLDNYATDSKESEESIHPFWKYFNQHLTNLYDPISRNKYHHLNLDEAFWQNNITLNHKYCNKTVSILCELFFLNGKYKPVKEIIWQSNPNSLQPIVSYPNKENTFKPLRQLTNTRVDLCQEFDDDDEKTNWFISDDYNPYEL